MTRWWFCIPLSVAGVLLAACWWASPTAMPEPTSIPIGTPIAPVQASATPTSLSPTLIPTPIPTVLTGGNPRSASSEGKVVVYASIENPILMSLLEGFNGKFPAIDTTDFYAAPCSKLVPRLLSEMRTHTASVDLVILSNMAIVADFQAREFWLYYRSPQYAAYDAKFKSEPEGYWGAFKVDGLLPVWDPRFVSVTEAPRSWADLLDPRWEGQIGFADAASPDQFAQWYGLRQAVSADYWDKMAQNKPRAFAHVEPMAHFLVTEQLKIGGQVPMSLLVSLKREGTTLVSSLPQEGVPLALGGVGILSTTQRPNAAKLLLDYFLSAEGQKKLAVDGYGAYSGRGDVEPPSGLPRMTSFKGIVPSDWSDYAAWYREFATVWEKVVVEE